MSRNWIRQCYIDLEGSSSKVVSGGGPTDLRIQFEIEASTIQSPNMAWFRITNPSQDTIAKLKATEFTKLSFYAGYQDNCGLVYSGDIKQSRSGKEPNFVDGFVDVFCGDGDAAYVQARVTKTLAAGHTPQDRLQAAVDAMKPFGVELGQVIGVDLSTPKFPRGFPMTGMARDIIRQVALSAGATWSIQFGKLDLVAKDASPSGSGFKLNGNTGLIGIPTQTQDGIVVTSLLNSALAVNSLVEIDQKSILEAEKDNSQYPDQARNSALDVQGREDGTYKIIHMLRKGDTYGQEWFDVSTCIGANTGSSEFVGRGYLGYS